jgi:hypothetical protein
MQILRFLQQTGFFVVFCKLGCVAQELFASLLFPQLQRSHGRNAGGLDCGLFALSEEFGAGTWSDQHGRKHET